jgi:hypothetical protein
MTRQFTNRTGIDARSDQVQPAVLATRFSVASRWTWELSEAQLTHVVGGEDGPGNPGDHNGAH